MKSRESSIFMIAADNYKTEVLSMKKASTYYNLNYLIQKLVLEFGHLKISSIDKKLIQRYIGKLNMTIGAAVLPAPALDPPAFEVSPMILVSPALHLIGVES